MPGVDFDRKAFLPTTEGAPRSQNRALGAVIFLVALLAAGILGYKVLSEFKQGTAAASDSQNLEAIQQQVAKLERRLEQLERRHKASTQESDPATNARPNVPVEKSSPKKTVYSFAPPTGVKLQAPSMMPSQAVNPPLRPTAGPSSARDDGSADSEAWQATTDRLADVAGIVGSQQGEIDQTREQLTTLLAQTRRSAVFFDLHRGSARQSVGPVSIVLKASDPRNQRYTVCVYLEDKCVELKDRTVDEVVVFVASRNSAPLELVATRVLRDRIVGYLEVPSGKATP